MKLARVAVMGALGLLGACSAGEDDVVGPPDDPFAPVVRDAGSGMDAGGGAGRDAGGGAGSDLGGALPGDGGGAPGSDGGAVVTGPERCNNGLDDDGDGTVDEDCPCAPGTMQRCYPGPAGRAGVGPCAWGSQTCEGTGEFGLWSACSGATLPAPDVCGNGQDEDCSGRADDGPDCCAIAGEGSCYTGPEGTRGVGVCRAGRRVCMPGMPPGPCMGEVVPSAELCNGVDDNCNGVVDEGCVPCVGDSGAGSPWQIHLGAGPSCFPGGRSFSMHGDPGEYQYASIPLERDTGWRAHPPTRISFDDPSTLCGVCDCRQGADFTYFQTSFYVPQGFVVRSVAVNIENVDDGVQVTVFNSRYPNGVVDPGAYAYLGGGSTADLARYIVPGRNRVVLTHVDDCCMVRRIAGATVRLNGTPLGQCAPP